MVEFACFTINFQKSKCVYKDFFFFFLLSQELKMVICEFYIHMLAFNFLSLSERFVFIHRILN